MMSMKIVTNCYLHKKNHRANYPELHLIIQHIIIFPIQTLLMIKMEEHKIIINEEIHKNFMILILILYLKAMIWVEYSLICLKEKISYRI